MNTVEICQAVIEGKTKSITKLIQDALAVNQEPQAILRALIEGMDKVGEEWTVGNMFIPEVLLSAQTMKEGMVSLMPHLSATDANLRGTVIIGTVKGDHHDIGKSLVGLMIEGAGFRVIDLGVDVPAAKFVEAIKIHRPGIVAMSCLLTTTLIYMRDTIRSIEEAGLRDSLKVLIGGAPITQQFADSIGADGYAPDGASAVLKVRELFG